MHQTRLNIFFRLIRNKFLSEKLQFLFVKLDAELFDSFTPRPNRQSNRPRVQPQVRPPQNVRPETIVVLQPDGNRIAALPQPYVHHENPLNGPPSYIPPIVQGVAVRLPNGTYVPAVHAPLNRRRSPESSPDRSPRNN